MSDEPGELPLNVVDRAASEQAHTPWWRLVFIPVIGLFMMLGGVIGLYFQPPGVRFVMGGLGLEPGGGARDPIAVPAHPAKPTEEAKPTVRGVGGLGKLIPRGDVISLATPFGAGDARIAEIRVRIGDAVEAGQILVVLDNESSLKEAVRTTRANLAVKGASLNQTVEATAVGKKEATANLARATATAEQTRLAFERGETLRSKDVIPDSELELLKAQNVAAQREVDRAQAVLSRFQAKPNRQVDVVVAKRSVDASRAELERVEADLEKAYIRAPLAATVLDIHGRVGERPGQQGVLDIGDLAQMVAEVEIYQSLIGRVQLGQKVLLEADALPAPLVGTVKSIGLSVGRQTLIGSDPAANTDARVVKIYADLDEASTAVAARFTNLQVVAIVQVDP